jgi:hypothetical protein
MNANALNVLKNKSPLMTPKKQDKDLDEVLSNTSIEDDTVPDEDFTRDNKQRNKKNSYPNILEHRGPNINLKIYHKRYSNQREKEMFFAKIKQKKRLNYVKIMNYIKIVIMVIIALLLMV